LTFVLKLAFATLAAAGLYVLFCVFTIPAPETPVKITVDAHSLPVSCEVLGAKMTLQPFVCSDGHALVEWSIAGNSSPIEFDETQVLVGDKELDSKRCLAYGNVVDQCRAETEIDLPKKTQRFDLVQAFHKSKNTRFKFANLDTNHLPVKKQMGSATVTLQSFGVEKLSGKYWTMPQPPYDKPPVGRRYAILQLDISMPGIYHDFEGKVTDSANGSSSTRTGGILSYNFNESKPALRADGGPMLTVTAYQSDTISDADNAFRLQTDYRTLPERLVSKVNPNASSRMVTYRAMSAARAAKSYWHVCLAYPTNGSLPKHISFEISVQIPPDVKDKAVVVFKNVPVR